RLPVAARARVAPQAPGAERKGRDGSPCILRGDAPNRAGPREPLLDAELAGAAAEWRSPAWRLRLRPRSVRTRLWYGSPAGSSPPAPSPGAPAHETPIFARAVAERLDRRGDVRPLAADPAPHLWRQLEGAVAAEGTQAPRDAAGQIRADGARAVHGAADAQVGCLSDAAAHRATGGGRGRQGRQGPGQRRERPALLLCGRFEQPPRHHQLRSDIDAAARQRLAIFVKQAVDLRLRGA